MGSTHSDAAQAAYDADREQEALDQAADAAEAIARELEREWQGGEAEPSVSVALNVGGDDQPVFVFSILLGLDEDFDVAEWPAQILDDLKASLRSRVSGTDVDDWDWLVTAAIKSGSSAA